MAYARVIALIAVISVLATASFTVDPGSGSAKPDILFISIEAANVDHLPCYGYDRNTTPNLCSVAEDGLIYRNAFSPSAMTVFSFTSMQTGKNSYDLGVYEVGQSTPMESETLAERLDDDYYSYMYSGNILLKRIGFLQGFDQANVVRGSKYKGEERPSPRWIAERIERNRSYIRIHLMEPHLLWIPYRENISIDGEHQNVRRYKSSFNYDMTLKSTDLYIGEIIEMMKARGVYDDTVIVITADHGEQIEGDYKGHTRINPDTVRVPLIIKPAGNTQKEEVGQLVSTIDIKPTLLSIASQGYVDSKRDLLSEFYSRERVNLFSGLNDQSSWIGITDGRTLMSMSEEGKSSFDMTSNPDSGVFHISSSLDIYLDRLVGRIRTGRPDINVSNTPSRQSMRERQPSGPSAQQEENLSEEERINKRLEELGYR